MITSPCPEIDSLSAGLVSQIHFALLTEILNGACKVLGTEGDASVLHALHIESIGPGGASGSDTGFVNEVYPVFLLRISI